VTSSRKWSSLAQTRSENVQTSPMALNRVVGRSLTQAGVGSTTSWAWRNNRGLTVVNQRGNLLPTTFVRAS